MNNLTWLNRSARFKLRTFNINPIWVTIAVCGSIILGTYNVAFSYMAFVLSVFSLFVLSPEDALAFMFFIMPFASIFKNVPGGTSFYTYLIFFYVAYNMLLNPKINKNFFIRFMFLGIYIVAQMFMSINLSRMIKFMTSFLLVYYALNADLKKDGKRILLYYIIAVILASLVSAFNIIPNLDEYIVRKALGGTEKTVIRFAGLYDDPNYYSINIIICLCLIVVLNNKKYLSNLSSVALAGGLLYFAVMTISKSGFLMLFLPLTMLLYSKIKTKRYFVFVMLLMATIVCLIALAEGRLVFFDMILSRFRQDEDISDLTTGRTDIWVAYFKYLFENPRQLFVGGGINPKLLGGFFIGEKQYLMGPHNTYIDMVYYFGCIGMIFLILTLKSLFKYKKKKIPRNFLNYSVLLSIVIMSMFLSKLFTFDTPFQIILAIIVMNIDFRDSKVEKKLKR